MRSFQFLLGKPSSFCPLNRLFDGYNQCVGANSVAKGGQRVITGYFFEGSCTSKNGVILSYKARGTNTS